MSLNSLLKSVLPNLPAITFDREIETLKMLPPETLFLALKEADSENALWVLENARPEQVQGVIDLDCWQGDRFLSERFFRYFEFITYTTPEKLHDYMKHLDPEVIVLALMDAIDVLDYDPQNPPEIEEAEMLISPDNLYVLAFKKKDPELRERIYQWMNKLSHSDIDLLRRHLESLKWEQRGDLEEFGYQIKKGRIEELGFVEREEAMKFFSAIRAPDLKKHLLATPLTKHVKEETPLVEILGSEDFLPAPIFQAIRDEGFFRKALERVEGPQLQDVMRMEVVRTVNAVFSAEDVLSQDLDKLKESATRTRGYLDLGLLYLAGGQVDAAAEQLVTQPIFEITRLGWTLVQDLVRASKDIRTRYDQKIFEPVDRELLKALDSRHPEISHPDLLRDLDLKQNSLLTLETIHKVADQVGALSVCGHFINEILAASLKLKDEPLQDNESAWTRLATGLFRQSSGREFSVKAVSANEWNELQPEWKAENFAKFSKVIADKIPAPGQKHFLRRLEEKQSEIQLLIEKKTAPEARYTRALRMQP